MTQTNPRLVLALSTLPSFVVHPLFSLIHSISAGIHYCATTFNHSISIASCQLLSYIPKYRQNLLRSQAVTQVTSIFFCNNPVYVPCYLVFHYRRQPEPPILHSFARLCRLVPMLGLLLSFLPVIFRFYLLMPFSPLVPFCLSYLNARQTLIRLRFTCDFNFVESYDAMKCMHSVPI